jgi:class I fructose-bisphosphate aldolase
VYFGSETSRTELVEVSQAFEEAHKLGMTTILWCYVRNNAFTKDGVNYETATDLTSQAVHLGVTIKADIIKQKLPDCNNGFREL